VNLKRTSLFHDSLNVLFHIEVRMLLPLDIGRHVIRLL
jgi:hypothetical protein